MLGTGFLNYDKRGVIMGYLYIFGTIFFTVYGQLILKWQVSKVGALPVVLMDKLSFIAHLFLNPWVISAFVSAFLASLFWMAALTKFELSYAYPFMSFSFIFVTIFGAMFFQETVSMPKILGLVLVVTGIVIGGRG